MVINGSKPPTRLCLFRDGKNDRPRLVPFRPASAPFFGLGEMMGGTTWHVAWHASHKWIKSPSRHLSHVKSYRSAKESEFMFRRIVEKNVPINKVYPKYESIAISRRTWCCGINFVFRWRSSRLRQEPQNATRTETWWAYGLRKNQTGWNLDECGACSHFLLHCLLAVCDFQVTIEFLCFFLYRNGSTKPTTGLLQTPQIQGW